MLHIVTDIAKTSKESTKTKVTAVLIEHGFGDSKPVTFDYDIRDNVINSVGDIVNLSNNGNVPVFFNKYTSEDKTCDKMIVMDIVEYVPDCNMVTNPIKLLSLLGKKFGLITIKLQKYDNGWGIQRFDKILVRRFEDGETFICRNFTVEEKCREFILGRIKE